MCECPNNVAFTITHMDKKEVMTPSCLTDCTPVFPAHACMPTQFTNNDIGFSTPLYGSIFIKIKHIVYVDVCIMNTCMNVWFSRIFIDPI